MTSTMTSAVETQRQILARRAARGSSGGGYGTRPSIPVVPGMPVAYNPGP